MRSGTWSRFGLVLLMAASLLVGVLVGPASATAATGGGTAGVAGYVTGAGQPLGGVTVAVLNAYSGAVLKTAQTDTYGHYSLSGLPAKPVKLRFSKATWLTGWAAGKGSFGAATVFWLQSNKTTRVPAQNMTKEAVIQGQVLAWMDPIGGATVSVLNADTGRVLKSLQLGESDYEYRIGGLAPGRIKVRATKPGYEQAYADGVHSFTDARVFTLHAGDVITQSWSPEPSLYLDLTPGGGISGEVVGIRNDPTNGWNGPLPGVTVTVLDADTGTRVASTVTGSGDQSGQFSVAVPPVGLVKVRFSKSGWLTMYADNATSWSTAATYDIQPLTFLTLEEQRIYSKPAI